MEWALIALAQAGFSMYQQQQQASAAASAQRKGERQSVENQNELLEKRLKRMRDVSTGGSVLGGATAMGKARQASQQGSILSSSGTGTLLGNTL